VIGTEGKTTNREKTVTFMKVKSEKMMSGTTVQLIANGPIREMVTTTERPFSES
jgi:hypothetical protein